MQLVFVFAAENDLAILESLKIFPIKGLSVSAIANGASCFTKAIATLTSANVT